MAVTNEQINAWLQSNAGASDADIAAAMNQYGVSTNQMAEATGFGLGDVQSRYNAAVVPASTQNTPGGGIVSAGANNPATSTPSLYSGLNAQSAPEGIAAAYQQFIQGAGGDTQANQQQAIDYLGSLGIGQDRIGAAYDLFQSNAVKQPSSQDVTQAATTTDPVFDPKLGVFQKVYDPRTGQEFISPAQAFSAGVTDYVTEMPMKLEFLNETSKKAVTDAMAGGATFDQALNTLGGKYGMSGKDFYNYEVQGNVRSNNTLPIQEAVNTQSGGLKPDELVAKLQAFKDKPPTTAQEFREQQALYADYARRYADSSWDYANMGGVAQDYSLKPQEYLKTQFTGYSDPLNKFLSGLNQNTPTFQKVREQLTGNPEIEKAIEDIYKLDPNHHLFTGSAGNLEGVINNLAGNISRIGKNAALKNFYRDQQNLVGFGSDNWFEGRNMGNPQWAELQRKVMSQTPVASDDKWDDMVRRSSGNRQVDGVMRDPTSMLGVGLLINEKTGRPDSVAYYDRDGRMLNASTFNKEDVYENLEKYGFDLSHVGDFGRFMTSRGVGGDMRGVTEDLSEMATPEWVDAQIKHLNWQNSVAGDAGMPPPDNVTQARIEEIRQTNEMAKRILSGGTSSSKAVDASTPENLLYAGLTENSTPEDIAAAYQQAIQGAGGDTQENQNRAFDYLTKTVGASEPDIAKAYGLYQATEAANVENALAFAYQYGQQNDDFSGLLALLNKTPNPKELISKYNLTPEQINEIEFGTGFDLDQSGGFGAGKVGSDWNYGNYLNELREGNTDNALSLYRSADPLGARRLENMYQELLQQQTVTGDNWAAGKLGSKDAAAMDFALRLMENGLDSIYDLGQRTIDVGRYDGEAGNYITQETEYFNKKTGEALPDWARVASGNKLNYQINFAEDGTPIPYTTPKQSDWMGFREGFLKPAISIVALANPALAPYIAAGNALNAASKGDWGSAIVSGLTAASGFSGDLGLTASTAATLNDAKTAAQVLNAIDKGNPVALATALMQTDTGKELMGQDMGGGIKMGDVVNTAKVAQLVNTGNYAEALATVGQMTNSPNLKLSASAVNLAQAFQTGDPFKIISAVSQLDRAVKSADTAAKKSEAETLKSAGLEEDVNLPSGIQLASLGDEIPYRAEGAGLPVYAEDSRAANVTPPPGYRLLSKSEEDSRLVSEGVGDLPAKYETIRPAGSYYDASRNAWLAPSGEFEAAMNVEDFSKYFGASSLSDADVEDIYQGVRAGDVTADDLYWLTGQSGKQLSAEDIQSIVSGISRPSAGPVTDFGEIVTTAKRPEVEPAYDESEEIPYLGEIVTTAKRPVIEPVFDEVATEEPDEIPDLGEMVVTAPKPQPDLPTIQPEPEPAPAPSAPAPTAPPKAPTVPPKLVQQVAQQLGVPATSQIAMDIAEALYGTMEYLDISEEFKPSERKAKPAATQKQQQQTKMAQGGYLDAALAEEMSVDELLNLLR